jgi:hypothetical protein
MRPIHVATTLAAVTAGLSVAVSLHRRTGARATAPTAAVDSPPVAVDPDGVVLPFVRPAVAAPAAERPAAPARCGDTGGVTKAGAPCGARATAGGRCHHHPVAA